MLPALRELLPRGGLARGSVVTVAEFGLLILALAAGASADGAWCGIAGVPEAGVLAAAGLGLDAERTLLVPDPGHAWPQVVASLLDGCELVLLRPPAQAPAQVRQRLEATLRRGRGVLLVVGDWPGAQVRLRVLTQGWTGLGDGHGRLRACCAQVTADGRGEAAVARTRWLWLPAEDGSVTAAEPPARHPGARAPPSGGAGRLTSSTARIMVVCCPGLCWPGGMTPPSPPGLAGPRVAREFDRVLTAVTAFCPAVEAVEPGVCAFGARGRPATSAARRRWPGRSSPRSPISASSPGPASPTGCSPRTWPPAPLGGGTAVRSWSSRRAGRRSSWPGSR